MPSLTSLPRQLAERNLMQRSGDTAAAPKAAPPSLPTLTMPQFPLQTFTGDVLGDANGTPQIAERNLRLQARSGHSQSDQNSIAGGNSMQHLGANVGFKQPQEIASRQRPGWVTPGGHGQSTRQLHDGFMDIEIFTPQPRRRGGSQTSAVGYNSSEEEFETQSSDTMQQSMHQSRETGRSPEQPGGSPGGAEPTMATLQVGNRKKELDEVKGIPAWPTTPQFHGWRRTCRYACSGASATPKAALQIMIQAERHVGPMDTFRVPEDFENLGVKFAKALRAILRGDFAKEIQTLEEKWLRRKETLLDGFVLYGIICRHFRENEKLARPLAMQEIQGVKPRPGKDQLRHFLSNWDASVEKLVSMLDDDDEPDKDMLYLAFKKHFMKMPELADQHTTVRRSLPNSDVHSYAWMYTTAKAVVESKRIQEQEDAREAAQEPDAKDPLTPAPAVKEPRKDLSKDPCPRMVSGGKCSFGTSCWYCHDDMVIAEAKKKRGTEKDKKGGGKGKGDKDKGKKGGGKGDKPPLTDEQRAKIPCRLHKKGDCKFGDKCKYSHAADPALPAIEQNGAAGVALGLVAIGEIATPATQTVDAECSEKSLAKQNHSSRRKNLRAEKAKDDKSTENPSNKFAEQEDGEDRCDICCPTLEEVSDEHIRNSHYPPDIRNCPVCLEAHIKEAPAKSHKFGPEGDPRIAALLPLDAVHMDTLHLTVGDDNKVIAVTRGGDRQGIVLCDEVTNDIFYGAVPSKGWQHVRDRLISFGGCKGSIKKIVSDKAPEFNKALNELGIAPYPATPGRSTSHAKAERANRTCLEFARSSMLQSGLSIGFEKYMIDAGLWRRRMCEPAGGKPSIYELRHPDCPKPSLWPCGAEVTFKPTKAFDVKDKCSPRGRKGMMLCPVANAGGSWNGDYYIAELSHFEAGSSRQKARVYQTKTVAWDASSRPRFPLAEAVELARKLRLAKGQEQRMLTNAIGPELADGEDDHPEEADEEYSPDAALQQLFEPENQVELGDPDSITDEALEQIERLNVVEEPTPAELKLTPREYVDHFRRGGWFNRLQRVPTEQLKAPNRGSMRPPDIPTETWAGCGPQAQLREIACRRAEEEGEEPPHISKEMLARLPELHAERVLQANQRAVEVLEALIAKQKAKQTKTKSTTATSEEAEFPDSGGASSSNDGISKPPQEIASNNEADDNTEHGDIATPIVDGDPLKAASNCVQSEEVWPEGAETFEKIQEWCKEQGVPGPTAGAIDQHRERNPGTIPQQAGFGMVTRPIAPGSAEWKSEAGQEAVHKEMQEHKNRGTWDMKSVMELDDLLAMARKEKIELVLGGVHPILGAKGAEMAANSTLKEALLEELRCRVVFTAPNAWTPSGVDPRALYDEITAVPITFQGSRTLRAYAALMGFEISSRDAKSAYLQSPLQRPGGPQTWIALPKAYWDESWVGKYKRPMVRLDLSLYGHPDAGERWDEQMGGCMIKDEYIRAPQWPSIFKREKCGTAVGVYVDDFEMASDPKLTGGNWERLGKLIEFGKPQEVWGPDKSVRHLGCHYTVDQVADGEELVTTITSEMGAYNEDVVRRFEERTGVTITPVATPWLDAGAERRYTAEQQTPGKYGKIAASPLMASLYSARATYPDKIIPTLRLARRVHRWTEFDDRKLIRFLGYMRWSAKSKLSGSLSTADRTTAIIRNWPDADLAGEPSEDTKSTAGSWVEIASVLSDRSMVAHYGAGKQTFTADSTTVAELGSMHSSLKNDALPIACLLEFLLGRDVVVETVEDNTSAISAAKAGYSKNLRYLRRDGRIRLGWLGEVHADPRNRIVYGETDTHKGDLLTKEFDRARFEKLKKIAGLSLCGIVTSQFVCRGGRMLDLQQHIAAVAEDKEKIAFEDLVPGENSWVVDTGSGHHLVSRKRLSREEQDKVEKSKETLRLATAGGVISCDDIVKVDVSKFGAEVCARVLKDTPRVLSVAKLVTEHGATFTWDRDGPRLWLDGEWIKLPVKSGVPLLAVPALKIKQTAARNCEQQQKNSKENQRKAETRKKQVR